MIKFFIFFVLVAFDLLSKKIVFDLIDLHTFIPLTIFLDLTHIHNFGVSFGLFSGLISSWILIILGLLVVAFIFYLMKKRAYESIGMFSSAKIIKDYQAIFTK